MATAVQIELRVDEQGAVQGVRAFDTSVKGTTGSVRQLGNELQIVGGRATTAGRQAKAALDQTGVAALSSVEKTRLLTEEFGIRLPRAMVRLAAESKITQAAISAIGPGLIALGSIQIGAMVFTQLVGGAKKLWDNYISLDNAAKAYRDTLEKTREEDYWKSDSIETTTLRIREATEAARSYRSAAEGANSAGWGMVGNGILSGNLCNIGSGVGMLMGAHQFAGTSFSKQQGVDKLTPQQAAQQHELNVQTIEYNHAGDAALNTDQKRNAELQKRIQLAAEERSYEVSRNKALGNPVAADAGAAKERLAVQTAQREADAETANERKEQGEKAKSQALELRHIHEEALQSGLRGSALYHEQESAAIEDLRQKGITSAQAVNDIHLKFHNEEMKRLADQTRETEKMERTAAMAGMTGLARTQATGAGRIADINANQDLTPENRARQIAAANLETHQEMQAEELGFTQHINQLADESAEHQISGFARIRAQAQKQIDALRLEYQKLYGTNVNAPEYQAHIGELNRGVGLINSGASEQTSQLRQRNSDETAQIELEARAHAMSAEKQQTLAIQAEYQARLEKYNEELKQQEISQDDYNRRVLAAEQLRDAQMVEAAKAAREKMAGEFTSLFKSLDHPMVALKDLGDKAAGQAAAAMVQRMQVHFGGSTAAEGQPGKGLMDGIFGRIAGAPKAGAARKSETGSHGAAAGLLSIGTAQIHIGSASVAFGGSTGRPAYSGARGYSTSGSTAGIGYGTSSGSGAAGSTAAEAGLSGGMGAGIIGSTGSAPAQSNTLSTAMGDVGSGFGLAEQGMGLFGSQKSSSTTNAGSSFLGGGSTGALGGSSKNGGMLGGGGFGSNAMGAASGAMGLFSAYEGNGGVGGALSGAMSGMQLGMALGGPMGAAIGAAAGAIVGAIGFGGREKARVYDLKQVRPRMKSDTDSYEQGSMDYLTAYSDMQSLDVEARKTTSSMGPAATSYYNDTIKKELQQAEAKFTSMQKAGRSQFTSTAAQFASGTDRVLGTGYALLHQDESVNTADRTERATRALERGADLDNVAATYRTTMQSNNARQTSSSGSAWTGDLHIHALDAKSSVQWAMQNKHVIRSAVNASYSENSGGADAGY